MKVANRFNVSAVSRCEHIADNGKMILKKENKMGNYLEGVKRAIEIIVEEQTTEHENDSARFVQTMKRLQEIVSNRLDGVVIQKPTGGISRDEFIKTILDIRSMTSAKGDSKLWKKINNLWEDVQVIGLIENGEGYAQGIGQTLEATKRTEKMLLDECCEALGWQGGTIHQVKNAIIDLQKFNSKNAKACIGCEYNVAETDIWYSDKCPDCARSERKDLYKLRKISIEQMHEDLKKRFEEK